MLKFVIVAIMAVGALAEYQVPEAHLQQARSALEEMCKKNGAENKVEDVVKGVTEFKTCLMNIFDAETIKKEIEEAKPNGALDEVFKKYCDKAPQLKGCIQSMTNVMAPCLDEKVRNEVIPMSLNSTDKLIDFVCYKDGDRIAMFIAEGGLECFTDKRSGLQSCFETIKSSFSSLEAAKTLTEEQKCSKFKELKECVVKQLEGCSTPTPANMVESLLQFISKSTTCPKW